MDNTSVITYAGDFKLFEEIETALVQAIPKESCEWKRPYGRAVKAVHIDASFVPFSKDTVTKPGNLKLVGQPILHSYWTECSDVETYKNSVKTDIEYWLKHVGTAHWMIIAVEVYDVKKTNKLLPRTTVLDKIRADFGVKQGDRILSLIHPIKNESKSAESWRNLVHRLRSQTLLAYNQTLSVFEEAIRSNRECRPLPSWSFCSYFTMQEEMALVLEMLGLYEEALVQYDELDALFTQFVVNSTKGETPKWLASFSVPLQQWAGPTLCKRVTPAQRELLRCSKLDLLQFRSYLFGRQCSLLILQSKPWEVAQRTMSFLHNSVQEMRILEVIAPDGVLATWIFLVCLEILQACEKFTESSQVEAYSVNTAGLWSYAREKLKQLGVLCGLAPGQAGPTSEQLHTVVQLSSGMGDPPDASAGHSPVDRLKEALSSKQAYNNYFMELSELAISTYKHIGRMRFAKLIGMELAELYLTLKQSDKAATFFSSTLQGLQDDKWTNLASATQLRLIQCYNDSLPDINYITCCAAIASSNLDAEVKMDYYQKFIKASRLFAQETCMVTSLNDIGRIQEIELCHRHQIFRGQCIVNARLKFFCLLPGPLECHTVSICIEKGAVESSQRLEETPQDVFRRLTIQETVDYKQDGSLNGANIICQQPQKAVRRTDSQGRGRKISTPLRKDFTHCLSKRRHTVLPGVNYIDISWTAKNTGRYILGQLSLGLPGLEFLETIPAPAPEFIIDQQKSTVEVQVDEKELIAGLPQKLTVVLDTGSYFILEGTPLVVSCSSGLSAYNGEQLESCIEVILPETEPFQRIALTVAVQAELPAQSDGDAAITHQVTVTCGWCDTESVISLAFLTPLRSVMRLHTVCQRKILQITMTGLTNTQLRLHNPQLQAAGIKVQSKNALKGQSRVIGAGLKVSLIWELDTSSLNDNSDSVPLTLIVEYSPVLSSTLQPIYYTYKCHFGIFNFKTLFIVRSKLEAGKEAEFCRVGSICQLHLNFIRCEVKNADDTALMYEVVADQTMWAICGRAAGVLTFEKDTQQSVTIDVMPQTQGYLPLPNVRLFRYIPASNKDFGKAEDCKARLEQFSTGQVYFGSKSEQVHILPAGSSD